MVAYDAQLGRMYEKYILPYVLPCPLPFDQLCDTTGAIAIVGVGGGQDICSCLPWFPYLSARQQALCRLYNYSFTEDLWRYGDTVVVEVSAQSTKCTKKNETYFPEWDLSFHLGRPVCAVRLLPCPVIAHALLDDFRRSRVALILAVDGGIDACLDTCQRHAAVGSPIEDSQMVLALEHVAAQLSLTDRTFIILCGQEIDICHAASFRRFFATLASGRVSPVIGSLSAPPMENVFAMDVALYEKTMRRRVKTSQPSIVHESILAALGGCRGAYYNPLLRERISNEEDWPVLTDDSTRFYLCRLPEMVHSSAFYRRLIDKTSELWPSDYAWLPQTPSASNDLDSLDRAWRRAVTDSVKHIQQSN